MHSFPSRIALVCSACAILLTACTHGTAQHSSALNDSQAEMIREIREKQHSPQTNAAEIQADTDATAHITVQDYIMQHGGISKLKQEYQVGGQDILTILVHEEKDLSRDAATVAADGTMTFPFIGRIDVNGKTPAQIEDLISKKLTTEGFLVNPHVSVQVKEFRSKNVVILGAVKNPGRFSLESQESLLDILSRAGGVDFAKGGSKATVMRMESNSEGLRNRIAIGINIKRLFSGEDHFANLPLQNEDVVFIPMAEKVYVMGEVTKPGEYIIDNSDATVVEAIGMAGGFTRIAAPDRTSLVRLENGHEQILTIPVDEITRTGRTSADITLRDKDIIIVPESYF